jgi:PiT family inorganic phosphate transporter
MKMYQELLLSDQKVQLSEQKGQEENENKLVSEIYRLMMVVSAFLVCLSHGSNDVGNAISPLIIILNLENINSLYSYVLGSTGIALGLLILGERVMRTVGKEIVALDF